jgi:D-serine deaminase-like pyridoxal phosphate-dependent protein
MIRLEASYFQQLNQILRAGERAIPCLLIDLDRLDHNIKVLQAQLKADTHFRIVVKSLPSFELLDYIIQRTGSTRLMVFHQPFLSDLSQKLDERFDLLLGKPMPIKTAAYYFQTLLPGQQNFNPFQQIQWLVDTPQRIQEYIDLAKSLQQKLRLNLEIDVGLHRGGFADLKQVKAGLQLIQQNTARVKFSGFMGYDPHVVKLPRLLKSPQKALRQSNDFYICCQELLRKDFPELWSPDLTFNGAGSPTLKMHQKTSSPLNEVAAGSCLVKPGDFDIPELLDYQPACFIATPILKKLTGTRLPGIEKWTPLLSRLIPRYRQSFFIYGGYWKADYCYPPGCRTNQLFGPSTNQSMVNAPSGIQLEVDDFLFLRPRQSEFVFLQFGELLPFRGPTLLPSWKLLQQV